MRKALLCALLLTSACAAGPEQSEEALCSEYLLPYQAADWVKTATLKELCLAAKNYCHPHLRDAALEEIHARNINTKRCYYEKLPLTP